MDPRRRPDGAGPRAPCGPDCGPPYRGHRRRPPRRDWRDQLEYRPRRPTQTRVPASRAQRSSGPCTSLHPLRGWSHHRRPHCRPHGAARHRRSRRTSGRRRGARRDIGAAQDGEPAPIRRDI
ncbi:hypothetical protein GCG21_09280 [Pseudactinotalea sp. HY160]|nr:hypothetical protein [Pseudactinotalea sp. HY160]